jgi:hypothetical protein
MAQAQSGQARIVGTVTDTNGAVIRLAAVTAKNERTGIERTVQANEIGYYVLANLPPASYTITAKAPELAPTELTNVVVGAGQERTIDIALRPATLQQQVTVTAGDLVVIDMSSARMGSNVSEREVATLPLNGRELSQLYLMAPGAVNNGAGTYDNIRFSGRSNQQNMIRYDGIEATSIIDASPGNLNGEVTSSFRLQSSLENVQEFRVESSNYPAEYGTGTGGQISIVTKSGSNDLHGSMFEYVRNSAFDVRNFFDRGGVSPLRVNQFGSSAGGPITKDKFFFFASYEGLRQRAGVNFVELVPSAAARGRAVASIQPLLAAYPTGQQASSNPDFDFAFLNASARTNENSGGARIDYRFNDKYSLFVRYFRDQGESYQPLGVTGNALAVTAVPQNGLVSFQQILRPTVINEVKFGVNANKTMGYGVAPAVAGVDMSAISVNMSGSVALAGIAGQGGSAGVATPGGLVRSNSASNGRAQPYTNYSLSFIDNLSWIRGEHSIRFGVEVRPIRIWTDRLGGTTYTYSNINDFLANKPSQVQFLGDVSAPSPFNGGATGRREGVTGVYAGYAQDEWKIRPTLTMTYGLRYEYYSVMREARNLDVVFNAATGQIMPPDTPFFSSSKLNFGPRLGFAWAPQRFRGNTVFRIGSGFYYGPGQTEDQIQPIESDRVSTTVSGATYPIDPAAIIAGYNINSPTLGYQPRAYAPGYSLPERVLSYTASIQQKVPGDAVLTVAYVGSQGRNLFLRSWTNQITGVSMNPTTGAAIIQRQFGSRFAEIDYKTSGGTDHYDSLQTTLNRRFSKGFTLGAQYTWGHSIGNTDGSNEARTAQNPYDFSTERSDNNFDVRHSFNLNALYELPFGRGRRFGKDIGRVADLVAGGWEVGGVLNARTGVPIEVGITRPDVIYQDTRNGQYYTSPVLENGVPVTVPVINTPGGGSSRNVRRPDLVPGVDPYLNVGGVAFINPAAFSMPAPGTYGNLARNALHGPGLAQLDLTLHKRFPISENRNVEFRAEVYNILNHANLANPPASLPNALPSKPGAANTIQPGQAFSSVTAGGIFGVLNSTVERQVGLGTSRQMQLSLRFNF